MAFCFLFFFVGIGAFVIGLGQISPFCRYNTFKFKFFIASDSLEVILHIHKILGNEELKRIPNFDEEQ